MLDYCKSPQRKENELGMFKNSTIQKRLTYLITLISLLSIVITILSVSIIGYINLKDSILSELNDNANNVGQSNIAYISFNQIETATKNLHEVFSLKPSVTRVCMYDANGEEAAHYFNKESTSQSCPKLYGIKDDEAKYSQGYAKVYRNLKTNESLAASIFVESDAREIIDYIQRQLFLVFVIITIVGILTYFLALALQKTISDPILELANIAKKVSAEDDYSLRVENKNNVYGGSENEIVVLIDAFNEMLKEIQRRDRELLKQNEELVRAKDTSESANRAKSHFLANVSHELRTPLNAIIGFSSVLKEQLFGALGHEKYIEYATDINEAGGHLLDIINDILDLSKAESGKLVLAFEEVSLERSMNKCMNLMAKRAQEKAIIITTELPKKILPFFADRVRFVQILLNIVSNAIKFTDNNGSVHIKIEQFVRAGIATDLVVSIKDNGIGMEKTSIQKVFQAFEQVDSALNRRYNGTGLGLPLTKKLVELHHGNISIKSEVGVGTEVIIHFIANPTYIQELLDISHDNVA